MAKLTDDEIQELRNNLRTYRELCTTQFLELMRRLLDEIEELRAAALESRTRE
jgi:hypothetical protein